MLPLVITLIGEMPSLVSAVKNMKAMFSANGQNVIIQIQEIQIGAVKSADEALAMIADWEAKHPKS
jgi:hypothetical protein